MGAKMNICNHVFLTSCQVKSIEGEKLIFIDTSSICYECGAVEYDIEIQINNTKSNYQLARKISDSISVMKENKQSIGDILRQYLKGKTYCHNQKSGFPFNE
jgi:hypothetical protein